MEHIKDIIFDLGGVIIGLDTGRTIRALADLTNKSEDEVLRIFHSDDHFLRYEKGQLSDDQFREFVNTLARKPLGVEAIDDAWNAMILDFFSPTIDLLRELKTKYKIHLLSNTNNIHMTCVRKKIADTDIPPFAEIFHNDFYSHEIGMRKPDTEIFEFVVEKGGMTPNSTLFLDDNLDNLKGAAQLGIDIFHVRQLADVSDYFNGQKA